MLLIGYDEFGHVTLTIGCVYLARSGTFCQAESPHTKIRVRQALGAIRRDVGRLGGCFPQQECALSV